MRDAEGRIPFVDDAPHQEPVLSLYILEGPPSTRDMILQMLRLEAPYQKPIFVFQVAYNLANSEGSFSVGVEFERSLPGAEPASIQFEGKADRPFRYPVRVTYQPGNPQASWIDYFLPEP